MSKVHLNQTRQKRVASRCTLLPASMSATWYGNMHEAMQEW